MPAQEVAPHTTNKRQTQQAGRQDSREVRADLNPQERSDKQARAPPLKMKDLLEDARVAFIPADTRSYSFLHLEGHTQKSDHNPLDASHLPIPGRGTCHSVAHHSLSAAGRKTIE
jgi:hypothetical protein